MIKKQQKWIALLVTLTLVWLLQVSAMPLAGSSTTEQLGPADGEQGPRYVEEEGDCGLRVRKSSALPVILSIVGVAAVAAVLFLVVLKTKYDIVGTWIGTEVYNDSFEYKYVFSGDKKSGTVAITGVSDTGLWTGTYTVDGKNVTMTVGNYSYAGTFDSKTTVKGTLSYNGVEYATFSMTKQ